MRCFINFNTHSCEIWLKNPFISASSTQLTFFCVNAIRLRVCALFNDGDGSLLIEHCLSKLEEINAQRVYLVSNTQLGAAINLYKKQGFLTVSEGPHPVYSRANIVMERHVF